MTSSSSRPAASPVPLKVIITGATGRTGSLVLRSLLARPSAFHPTGLARSTQKASTMFPDSPHALVVANMHDEKALEGAMKGCKALVILTSAVPKIKLGLDGRPPPGPPSFYYDEMPEKADWEGQKLQIDVAKRVGVEHIVQVGSQGSYNSDHPLNKMGNGNILVWKRKAEEYLIASGVAYTVINPGGLLDKPGGRRKLVVGARDQYIGRTVPREDLAEMVVQALERPEARGKVLDLVADDEQERPVSNDFKALFESAQTSL